MSNLVVARISSESDSTLADKNAPVDEWAIVPERLTFRVKRHLEVIVLLAKQGLFVWPKITTIRHVAGPFRTKREALEALK